MREYVIKLHAEFLEHLLRDGTQAAKPTYMPKDLRVVAVVQNGDIIKLVVQTDETIPDVLLNEPEEGRPVFVPRFKVEAATS